MPRRSRIVLSDTPHHIIQRGHNRQSVFACDEDYLYYLENLKEWKTNLGCKVYAYCLMTNHVHLVVDPGTETENLALLLKRVAGRQTRYVNKLEKRSGTLWEGRYKSSPIEAEEYLLACNRYIELNPVRAGLVDAPEKYKWSSCRYKTGTEAQEWLDLDPFTLSLGSDGYKKWISSAIAEGEWELIREVAQRGQLTGSNRFVEEVDRRIGKRVAFRKQGRPKAGRNK